MKDRTKYYNPINLHLSGREFEVVEELDNGNKVIKFPSFSGEIITATKEDLNETYKSACEKRWQAERERIAETHRIHTDEDDEDMLSGGVFVEKDKINKMLEDAINEVFHKCQNEMRIESGDIEPLMALELEEKQKELSETIWKALFYQVEQKDLEKAPEENAMERKRRSKCR